MIDIFPDLYRSLLSTDNYISNPLWPQDPESLASAAEASLWLKNAANRKNKAMELQDLVHPRQEYQITDLREAVHYLPRKATIDDLIEFNAGAYGVRIARNYIYGAQIRFYQSHCHKVLLCTGFQSRYRTTQNQIRVYIKKCRRSFKRGLSIYCNCKAGSRSNGACAHGLAAMVFLIVAKEQLKTPPPEGPIVNHIYLPATRSHISNVATDITEFSKSISKHVKHARREAGEHDEDDVNNEDALFLEIPDAPSTVCFIDCLDRENPRIQPCILDYNEADEQVVANPDEAQYPLPNDQHYFTVQERDCTLGVRELLWKKQLFKKASRIRR